MSTGAQEKAKKNTQASASLILGVISIIFALFNFAPGLLSAIGFVGVVAALLAFLAGVRGLRAARELEDQGRKIAIAGFVTGGVGFLLFIITFIVPIGRDVREVEALLTPQPPQTFQGDGFTLTFPGGWIEMTDAITEQEMCKQPGIQCVLAIGHPSRDGTNVNLVRFTLDGEATIEEIDQALWAQVESRNPGVNLESRDIIQVGGQPAVRRVFSNPSSSAAGQQNYILQVYVVKGLTLYQFTGLATSSDALTQHRNEIEEIINSMQFSP